MSKQITNCPICNTKLELQESKNKISFYHCKACDIGGKGKTADEAKKNLIQSSQKINTALAIPKNRQQVTTWAEQNLKALIESSAQFIDKPETRRMIQKNVNYIIKSKHLIKAWETEEGRESIIEAFLESIYYGATLPEMGSIVLFSGIADFIPAIETFDFALCSGKNPPFKYILIECLYENDQYEGPHQDKKGEFFFEIKHSGFPRGEIIGVIVKGFYNDAGFLIGRAYDIPTLMGKAEQHSKAYQYYLKDLQALRINQSEGKNYIEKWGKKLYETDITNPYVNADRMDMLMKTAGKNFFKPKLRIRNSRNMQNEWDSNNIKDIDDIYEKTLDNSLEAMKSNIQEAEIVEEPEREETKEQNKSETIKETESQEGKDLFSE